MLKIGSFNVDTLRTKESIDMLLHSIEKNNLDIICIQETHNEIMESVKYENYTIYYGGCEKTTNDFTKKPTNKAGVAIAIKNNIVQNVISISRLTGRLMEIKIKTSTKTNNINIVNSYAPHHGYNINEIKQYWKTIKSYYNNTENNTNTIWCTDNNGQISQNESNKENIGKWTIGNDTNEYNGNKLTKICKDNNLVVSNTFFQPKNGLKHKLATWHNYDGTIARQIDFFIVSKEIRNWVTNIENNLIANPRQNMQHKALIITIQIKLKRQKQIQKTPNLSTSMNTGKIHKNSTTLSNN